MGFEPQTAGQPLVQVRKRTTKVNLVMVAAVLLFFLMAALFAVREFKKHGADAPNATQVK